LYLPAGTRFVQEKPRIVDLFCGCGGFSLGAHAAGLAPTVSFDVDPILTSSFQANFPRTKLVLTDLSRIEASDIRRDAGKKIDGVFGGPPCQAFSSMGHRNIDDPRRSLLGHFFRLVAGLRPSFFVMENVTGLGYVNARPVLDEALSLLPSRYKILGPLALDASDYGAATQRLRMFVIGFDPDRFGSLTEHDVDAAKKSSVTVGAAIADLASAVPLDPSDGFDLWKIKHRGRPSRYAAQLRTPDGTFTGHRRTAHTREVVARFKRVKPGATDAVGRHPRLDWDGSCPTLRAGTGNDRGSFQSVRPIHPVEPRVITVREGARLQGFPDGFRFHPTVWHSFRMIGNSVSPIIAKALFSLIAERLERRALLREAAE